MYLYVFIAANDIGFANSTAKESQNGLDLKQFSFRQLTGHNIYFTGNNGSSGIL